jgi:hypothetical protein
MRIVLVHTDLRLYWLPRLTVLGKSLREQGDEFCAIEIACVGSRKLSSRMRQFLLQIKLYWIACFGASLGGLIQTA